MRKPKATEHEIQAAIVDALRLAGLTVFETTAYRQKGPSGVDRAIPDLLISVDYIPHVYFGIEVKRPGEWTFSSPEQRLAYVEERFVIAQSPAEALRHVEKWIEEQSVHNSFLYNAQKKIWNVQRSLEAA